MTRPAEVLAPIAWARKIGEAKGQRSVIILQELQNGQWGYTSWGCDRADCKRARAIADEVLGAVEYAVAVEDEKI